jgi:hypothetical protein
VKSRNRIPLYLERLEGRDCPSLTIVLDATGTLHVTGTTTSTLTLNNTAADQIQVQNGATNLGTYAASSLSVTLGNEADNVILNLTSLSGAVAINTGGGFDSLTINNGTISGNLNLGGTNVMTMTGTTVGGSVAMVTDAVIGTQSIAFINSKLGGNASLNVQAATVANSIAFTNTSVGGGLFVTNGRSPNDVFGFDPASTVGGPMTYAGGNAIDAVTLSGKINGSAYLNLGNGTDTLNLSATAAIGGNLTYQGGNGVDTYTDAAGTTLSGNLTIVLGNAANTVTTNATILGSSIAIYSGNGGNTINFNAIAPGAHLITRLGSGNDTFNLQGATLLASAFIDGGGGTNTFNASIPINFPITLINF